MKRVLEVKNLKTYFKTMSGLLKAVDSVSYHINQQEIVGIVGESGCGKSVAQLSTLQLIPVPPGEIVDGEIIFEGQDLLKLDSESDEMRIVRGGGIGMIFQEPMTSLNPVLSIAEQLIETMQLHLNMDRSAARKRAVELLDMVGIPDAKVRINNYPHHFSGGMRQRVMIAMAMSCNPKLLIADEPTTALDVTTQAQLLELMADLVKQSNTSLIIVTHNLGVVARYAERIYVMYAGRVVESGTSKEIFLDPRHPYTIGLLNSVPRLDQPRRRHLVPIVGMPPDLIYIPHDCAFRPRCPYEMECQLGTVPDLRQISENHYVRCYVDVRGDIS